MKYDDQPVRVFRRFWRCPVCDDGHTEFFGPVLMCNPPKYQHRCMQCGSVFSAEARTGDIVYEYAEASNADFTGPTRPRRQPPQASPARLTLRFRTFTGEKDHARNQ